jgi:hypothetical protein
MGCNCGSTVAKTARAQITTLTQPTVVQKVVTSDGAAKSAQEQAKAERVDVRKDRDETLCPVCKIEVIYRLENVNNKWVRVRWCQRCNTRIK